jgi:hypothetical protein
VSQVTNGSADPIKQLRKEMGFWDVLLFNIATVLGPRWVAAATHNGTSSISLWFLAAGERAAITIIIVGLVLYLPGAREKNRGTIATGP